MYIDDEVPVLAIQEQSREKKHQFPCTYEDCNNTTVNFAPHPIKTTKADDIELPTIDDFVLAQSKDAFCYQMRQLVGTPNYLTSEKNVLLVRRALLDGSIQKLVTISLPPPYYTWSIILLWQVTHASAECRTTYIEITTGLT